MELNKIYQGDCMEIIKKIDDKSINMILVDPPYNVSRKNNFQTMGSASRVGMDFGEWDKGFDLTSYINLFPRILKNNSNVVIFNAWENLKEVKDACLKNNILIKRCLVLNKSNPAPFNRDRMFVNDVEFALWGVYNDKNKPTKWTFNRENPVEKCVINTTVQSSKLHPTMKDLKVIQKLILLLSNKNEIILDCFAGPGTTGLSCKNLDRNCILIEKDQHYCEISRERTGFDIITPCV